MVKFKDLPIKNKLTIFIMASTLISVLILSSVFIFQQYNSFKQQMSEEFTTITKIIADRSNAAILFEDTTTLNETLSSLSLHKQVLLGCTYNSENRQLAKYHRANRFQTDYRFKTDYRLQTDYSNLNCPKSPKTDTHLFRGKYFYISEPITIDGEVSGLIYIQTSTEKLNVAIRKTAYSMLGLSSLIIVAALLFAGYIQRFISDPLIKLQEIASQVSIEKAFFPKTTKQNNDEIGALVSAFNSMLDSLSEQNKVIIEHQSTLEKKVNERTKELAIANKELEAFSYSVSHDLKAPLRTIEGFSLALIEDYGDELDNTAKDYLNRVRRGSTKMSELITNLLQLSRATRKTLKKEQVDFSALCEKVSASVREQDLQRSANIQIEPNMLATGDTALIEIILDNIIGNAWKYSNQKDTTDIQIGTTSQLENTIYYIKDSGSGFSMKYADQLFEPFKRLHSEDEFEGTGIGLATVARIIERHHGKIWAESQPGIGTQFYFSLFPVSSNSEQKLYNNKILLTTNDTQS